MRAGHSPCASRAAIDAADDFRGTRDYVRRWVPVWQNRQVSVQPTCDEMQTLPRSSA